MCAKLRLINNLFFKKKKKKICFYVPPEHEMDANFAWIIVQIHFLLNKFYNISHIMLKISNFRIFKNISSPGKKAFKSGYRESSRRLRNAALVYKYNFGAEDQVT